MLQLEQIPSFCTVCYLLFYVFTHMCDIIPLPDNLNCDIVLITVNGTLCFKYFSSSPKLCVFSFLYIALFMSILLFSSLFLFSFFFLLLCLFLFCSFLSFFFFFFLSLLFSLCSISSAFSTVSRILFIPLLQSFVHQLHFSVSC